jgi:guanylate kinase
VASGRMGRLYVISGPSGSGKTTLVSRVKSLPGFFYSVSVTTRAPRRGEVDGRDYYFVTREKFEDMVRRGEFAEHALVAGNMYGTPNGPLMEALGAGLDAVIDIDVQGAMQIKAAFPDAVLIFIEPPSMKALEERLRGRGTESEAAIRRRLELAENEMKCAGRYDRRIVNDDLEGAVKALREVLLSEEKSNGKEVR